MTRLAEMVGTPIYAVKQGQRPVAALFAAPIRR